MDNIQQVDWKIGTSYAPDSSITLQEIKNAGIDCIELVISEDEPDLTLKGLRRRFNPYIKEAHDLSVSVWSIHLPFGVAWDISTLDLRRRNEIINHHYELLKWVNEWGVKHVIIHPSFEPISNKERESRMQACKYSLNLLAEEAKLLDIHICVEDLPRTCLGNTSEEMKALIKANENLAVCCDVNHLLTESPVEFIKEIGTKLKTVHMSDYDGKDEKHWLPGKGIIKWNDVISVLSQVDYEGPFMFEVNIEEGSPTQLVSCWNDLLEAYRRWD